MARRGRPPGSKIEYQVAEEIPASCPKCGSTKLKVVEGRSPTIRPYSGPMDYDRVVWRMKQCECGQYTSVRTYEKELRKLDKPAKTGLNDTA